MKKRKIEVVKDRRVVLPVIFLVLGLFLFSLELLKADLSIDKAIHWVSDPVTVGSENAGKSISEYLGILFDIPKVQKELNSLKVKLFNYESQIAYISILEEENTSLRQELNLGNKEHKYVEAKVLGNVQENTIRINAGESQDIQVGDTVSLGYSFVGIVIESTDDISTVRSPYSKSSTFKVRVASSENKKNLIGTAVVVGSGEEYISIENISKSSGVKVGDYVILNDEKVVDNLVLGKISELESDPASIYINGKVETVVNLEELISVFVCTEW
jgi:cell shape-determining protein MreC